MIILDLRSAAAASDAKGGIIVDQSSQEDRGRHRRQGAAPVYGAVLKVRNPSPSSGKFRELSAVRHQRGRPSLEMGGEVLVHLEHGYLILAENVAEFIVS